MNDHQYKNFKEEMKSHVETVIDKKVNGKIDAIKAIVMNNDKKMDAFIERATPAVRVFENMTWLKKIVVSVLVFLGTVAGAWTFIQALLKK